MTVKLSSKLQITKLSDEAQEGGYPFEAVILSGEPIEDWGRFVVDLSTMQYHKPRLTVNYNHNDELIIGYGENFHVTPEGLKSTGKLATGTFADEIVNLAKQGVPFEASAEIDLCNGVETRVGAEASVVVNGKTYQGPISVYSQVPLRAYAICPCGADKLTTLTLLKKEIEFTMPKKSTTKLSNDDKNVPPDTNMEGHVKDQSLADLCAIFGNDTGVKLFQEGTDVAEVKQWQSLNDKYAKYLSSGNDDDEVDPPAEDDPPKTDDEPDTDPPKKDDDEKLSATLTKLNDTIAKQTKLLESQTAEITKLKASMPRGEDPLSHNSHVTEDAPKKNSVSTYAARYKQ